MLIDVYSVMHNEEVLLPYWLRHYEQFANRIFVWDDDSTDGTTEMLMAHPKVTLLPLEKHGPNNEFWVEELFPRYEKHSRGRADWVFFADADELIYHPEMVEALKRKKAAGVKVIWCRGFAMISEGPPKGSGQIYNEIRLGLPDKLESKWTVFDPSITLRFQKGRHGSPKIYEDGVLPDISGEIKLLHYRYMGPEFFEQRDMVFAERFEMTYQVGYKYSPENRRRLPDKSRGSGLEWYARHKGQAVDVVDL